VQATVQPALWRSKTAVFFAEVGDVRIGGFEDRQAERLLGADVAADAGPVTCSYGVVAAFMSSQQHERGIHAVRARCWRGRCDGSPFPVCAAAYGAARADQDHVTHD
jgi:hypothetical protein